MLQTLSQRERLTYLGLAFLVYLLVRHVVGPLSGLDGWLLTVSAYACAIGAATSYLYLRLRPHDAKKTGGE